MKAISNVRQILEVRNHIIKRLQEVGDNTKVYSMKHPTKNLPDSFIIVKSLSNLDRGDIKQNGVIEVCLYAKNLSKEDDQTEPNLKVIDTLCELVNPMLSDRIIGGTAITSIRSKTVDDSKLRYHYESLICETFSVKQSK